MERHDEGSRANPERGPVPAASERPATDRTEPTGYTERVQTPERTQAPERTEAPQTDRPSEPFGPAGAPEERKAVNRQEPAPVPEDPARDTSRMADQAQAPGDSRAESQLEEQPAALSREDSAVMQRRWDTIQAQFIDDPRAATREADALVGELMERMARLRQEHHAELRRAFEQDGGDTEGMRVALRRYRLFFQSLLGA